MRPEPSPVLKGKCAKEFMKEVEKPLKPRDIKTFKEADRIFEAIKEKK